MDFSVFFALTREHLSIPFEGFAGRKKGTSLKAGFPYPVNDN